MPQSNDMYKDMFPENPSTGLIGSSIDKISDLQCTKFALSAGVVSYLVCFGGAMIATGRLLRSLQFGVGGYLVTTIGSGMFCSLRQKTLHQEYKDFVHSKEDEKRFENYYSVAMSSGKRFEPEIEESEGSIFSDLFIQQR